jgi:uncharacterized protein (DUF983 family)
MRAMSGDKYSEAGQQLYASVIVLLLISSSSIAVKLAEEWPLRMSAWNVVVIEIVLAV